MLEPDIAAFVARTAAIYPGHAAMLSPAQQRAIYDRYAAAFTPPLPAGLRVENAVFDAAAGHPIALRLYAVDAARVCGTVLYFHGGGFVLGSLDSHEIVTARIAADTGLAVVAVDYRLAPEHPAPAAHDDCLEIARAALAGRLPFASLAGDAPLFFAGDSAGGNLAASVAMRLRDLDDVPLTRVAGLALVYPMLGYEPQPPARDTEAHAPMLTLADVHRFRTLYWGAAFDEPDGARPPSWMLPLDAQRFDGLPPVLSIGVEHDPLRDDARVFAERIVAAGGVAHAWCGAGLVHGCWRALRMSAGVTRMHGEVCRFLLDHAMRAG